MGIKELSRRLWLLVAAMVLAFGFVQPATAELLGYEPDLAIQYNIVGDEALLVENGEYAFPLWFMDAKSLKLRACLDDPAMCVQEIEEAVENGDGDPALFEHEFIYWAAEAGPNGFAAHPDADDDARARFILALEGFIEELPEEEGGGIVAGVFNEVLIHMRGLQPGGTYTVVHPFSATPRTAVADERGRLSYAEPAEHPVGNALELFDIALEGPIQHFLYSDTLLPIEVEGRYYLGDPTFVDPVTEEEGHTIFGSPFGINYVRVTGPGLPEDGVFADHFVVSGQIFFDENLAPIADFDVAITKLGEPVIIDVLENDLMQGDVPINPTSLERDGAITNLDGGNVTPVRELDNVLLQFIPDTAGLGGFDYTVQTFTGESDTASVWVFVEDLQFSQAEYRARTGKWTLNGTSSFRDLSVTNDGLTGYFTDLFGTQEVPPVTSAASGASWVIIPEVPVELSVEIEVDVAPVTPITRAHIHLGDVGANGGRLFDLCGEAGTPPCGTMESFSAVLDATDVRAVGDIAAGDFAAAVQAIRDGRTYVNVHTEAFPGGEIRGQIGRNLINLRAGENGPALGAAEVQEGGGWSYSGKSIGSPGTAPHMIHAESSLGNVETLELQLR